MYSACDMKFLASNNITHVLSIIQGTMLPPSLQKKYDEKGIVRLHFERHDNLEEDILSMLKEVCDFIETALSAQKNVLVHCVAGRSRSGAVVIAYSIPPFPIDLQQQEF